MAMALIMKIDTFHFFGTCHVLKIYYGMAQLIFMLIPKCRELYFHITDVKTVDLEDQITCLNHTGVK